MKNKRKVILSISGEVMLDCRKESDLPPVMIPFLESRPVLVRLLPGAGWLEETQAGARDSYP